MATAGKRASRARINAPSNAAEHQGIHVEARSVRAVEDGVLVTEKLSYLPAREIGTGLGVRIAAARYQIIMIEMGRIVDGLVLEEWEKKIEDDNLLRSISG